MVRIILADSLVVAKKHSSAFLKECSLSPHAASKRLLINLRLIKIKPVLARSGLVVQPSSLFVDMQSTWMPLANVRRVVSSVLQ